MVADALAILTLRGVLVRGRELATLHLRLLHLLAALAEQIKPIPSQQQAGHDRDE